MKYIIKDERITVDK